MSFQSENIDVESADEKLDRSGEASTNLNSNRAALIRLIGFMIVAVLVAWYFQALAVLLVVLLLVVMVMVHEFGHFITAKLSKMKVTEYFVGFGPALWQIRKGETSYGVKAIPAGGYVKIIGMSNMEEVDPADEPRTYRQASFPRRFLVGIAGSFMHFVMAFILIWIMLAFTGIAIASPANNVSSLVQIAGHQNPAQAAGIKPGDLLLGVDGKKKPLNEVINAIETHPFSSVDLMVQRGKKIFNVKVAPLDGERIKIRNGNLIQYAKTGNKPQGFIGVELGGGYYKTENPISAIGRSVIMLGSYTKLAADGFTTVFSASGLDRFYHQVVSSGSQSSTIPVAGSSSANSPEVISIVGAVQIGAQAAGHNVSLLLYILVMINLFVGMANMLPMLPLDGGHVVIAVYERIRSRKGLPYHADVKKLMPVAYVFLIVLLVIGLGALYSNIVHPVQLP